MPPGSDLFVIITNLVKVQTCISLSVAVFQCRNLKDGSTIQLKAHRSEHNNIMKNKTSVFIHGKSFFLKSDKF